MVLTPGQALDPSEQEPWARGQAVGEIFSIIILAERKGFGPLIPCGIHAFQACALDQLCDLSKLVELYHF